jgi:uridine kinase
MKISRLPSINLKLNDFNLNFSIFSGSGDEVSCDNVYLNALNSSKDPSKKLIIGRKRTTSTSEKDGNIHIKGNRTVYTAGRPPWYNTSGQINEPLVVGICGGSASGKTTVAKKIIEELNVQWVSLLSMDSFYKV